jgi:23S rRNA-/tRNA-specific pseudouridylate synthase
MGWISIDYKTELAMNDSDRQLSILYIDDQIIVVNKPSGLRTIPDGYDRSLPCLKDMLSSKFGRIWTVHRLDKETAVRSFSRATAIDTGH